MIRVLIVDDHAIVREGIQTYLSGWPEIEVIGEASDGLDAIQKSRELKPDVILMDLMMPKMNGMEAIHAIRMEDSEAKILVLTSFSDDDKVFPAIRAGALGYLLKDSSAQELVDAVMQVSRGESSLHPTIARKVIRELSQGTPHMGNREMLTDREVEVIRLVAQGFSNQEIAEQLCLSKLTVRTHISNILTKLHLENRTQAALFALKEGLVIL